MSDLTNPFPYPLKSAVGMDVETMMSRDTRGHHPDPNNKNYPLCWRGENKVASKEVTAFSIGWVPQTMTCQDCKEWLHA